MSTPFSTIEPRKVVWRDGLPYSHFNEEEIRIDLQAEDAETLFIQGSDLPQRWSQLSENKTSFVVAETAFGSGLHFLLSWHLWLQCAPKTACLYFIASESHPIPLSDLKKIHTFWPQLEKEAKILQVQYPILTPGIQQLSFEKGRIKLILLLGEPFSMYQQLLVCGDSALEAVLRTFFVDAWFLNENMTQSFPNDLIKSISMLSTKGTTAVFNNTSKKLGLELQSVGFTINNQYLKYNYASIRHKKRYTPWHLHAPRIINNKTAIVLGAGLAGCFTAYSLAKRGWKILLIEEGSEVANGASGNEHAILYPKLSASISPHTSFMLSAYLYAHRFYTRLLETEPVGELLGIVQLAYNLREEISQQKLDKWLASYPELGKLVSTEEASVLAGIKLYQQGLHLPLSGWLNCKMLCQWLSQQAGIQLVSHYNVDTLAYEEGVWWLGQDLKAETVIIANGFKATQFSQTAWLPLKAISGQLTIIPSNEKTDLLKIPLCAEKHVLPAQKKQHVLGATYHQRPVQEGYSKQDDIENMVTLAKLFPHGFFSQDTIGNWQGTRAATPDYLPLVGPVPNVDAFLQNFNSLASDSKRWLPMAGDYYPGLYLCTGFGSRGLTTAPLSAEWLAAHITNEPTFLPHHLAQALSPARFLIRKITRK